MILIFLHYLILMSPSLFLLFPLCFHLLLHQGFLLAKLVLFNLNLFLMLLINLYLRLLTFFLQTLLLIIYTILHNHCSIFLKKLELVSNITLFVNLSCYFNTLLLVQLAKPLFITVNFVPAVTVYVINSVTSAQHIHRLFPLCIVLNVSLGTFLI